MDKLNFIVEWDTPREKTWSGTVFGLYTALRNHFSINEINVCLTGSFFKKVLRKLGFIKYDMAMSELHRYRTISKRSIGKDDYIFQFAEVLSPADYPNNYIYQDLSVPYLKYLLETSPDVFEYSGFAGVSKSALSARSKMQMEYYMTCKGIFTMGEWLRDDFVNRLGIESFKVHCVGGGINLDKNLISPRQKSNNKILFVGRDFQRKGGYLVYKAFCDLIRKQPDVELHVAGPKTNPISNPISGYFYYGDSNHEKLSELFNSCDIFCMPSYFEAYGLVFIEALCYGLPCIGRNCYEMPYFIQNGVTGLLINDDDIECLSDCMYRLLHDEKIKYEVVTRRNDYLEKYSWDSVADRIEKVISKKS